MSAATESFNFELRLIDAVSPTAKKQADAVKKLDDVAQRAQRTLSQRFAGSWEKIGLAADRATFKQQKSFADVWSKVGTTADRAAQKQSKGFSDSWAKIGLAAERSRRKQDTDFDRSIRRQLAAVDRAEEKMRERSFGSGVSEGFGLDRFTKAAFFGSLMADGVMKAGEIFIEAAKTAVEIFADGVRDAFRAAGREQTQRIGENLSLRAGAGEFREDTDRFSKLTGFDDDVIRKMLLPMRRAGFGQQAARTAFAAATDVAAGEGQGGNAQRVSELLDGFQRIMLKGGVGEKQLLGMGVGSKEFFADLAKQMHVSTDTAKKRAESGKVDPQLLLNTIYRGIERKQGGQLGTGAIAYSQSFEARKARLLNLPDEYFKKLVDSPAFARANDMMAGLLDKLDPDSPAGRRIMTSIESMFDRITGFVGDPADAAGELVEHIENAVDFGKELVEVAGDLADAFLPSLETVEDMIIAFRKMKVLASGNVADQIAVAADQAKIDQRRTDRKIEKQVRGADSDLYAGNLRIEQTRHVIDTGGAYGPVTKDESKAIADKARYVTDVQENQMRKAGGATAKVIQLNVHPGAVVVHAAPGGDDQAHREAGEQLGAHVQRELEKAAQQGGG